MALLRSRSLGKHLKLMLSSTILASPLAKNPARSFKTLAPSSCPARILSQFSSFKTLAPLKPYLRSLSSVSLAQEVDWREDQQQKKQDHQQFQHQDSFAEDESRHQHLIEVQQEKQSRKIPVKAYFVGTSIDLTTLQSQNTPDVILSHSRATKYIVLRYYVGGGNQQWRS